MAMSILGADVSTLEEVEDNGGSYRVGGDGTDLFQALALHGVNTIRLRLWVDPHDEQGKSYLGGANDLATTIRLARRAAAAGLGFLLDLHYSDFWTDPKKQSKPKAWRGLTGSALETRVYEYTRDVLRELGAAGVPPTMVQVGNEITNGMLWPDGETPHYLSEERKFQETDPADAAAAYDRLGRLLAAGSRAVREFDAELPIALHLDFGGASDLYRGWFDEITARGVDYDVIGLSYYPIWHGTLADLAVTLTEVSGRYGKDVLILETAYGFRPDGPPDTFTIFDASLAGAGGYPASVDGQGQFLRDLIAVVAAVPDGHGLGIVYWEPAWLPVPGTSWASEAGMFYGNDVAAGGNPWANQALFDYEGNALPSLGAFLT